VAVHPIRVVAERTGLSPDVLRVWERRYRVVEPARDAGGRRVYADADIEYLGLLGRATAAGRSIGKLANLSREELAELVRTDEAARRSRANLEGQSNAARHVEQAIERVRALDGAGLEGALRRAAALLGVPVLLEAVVAPLFRRIGDEWHAGTMSPAQEHLASAVVRSLLATFPGGPAAPADAPRLVVATLEGERHEIGALLVATAAMTEGWSVIYLGPDLPAGEIARAAAETAAEAVAVSIVYMTDRETVRAGVAALRAQLPRQATLLVGGGGAAAVGGSIGGPGIVVLGGLDELRTALRNGTSAAGAD
jgi:MerR family transcriptional regulator, light-induced transcriptional regulator